MSEEQYRQQPGDAEKISAAADLLMGKTAESVEDAKPDDVQTPPPEAPAAAAEEQSSDDLLAQLLSDPEPDQQASASEKVQLNSLEALAQVASVEVSDLYNIAVPMADGGEPMTIGQLKDGVQSFRQERETFETNRITQESEILRARQELQQLVQVIGPDNLKPEALELMRGQQTQYLQEQQRALLAMRPEWAEPEKAKAAQAEIAGALESYGFTPAERERIADARLIKAFHDLAVYSKRIAAANERMSELRSNAKPAAPRGRKAEKPSDASKIINQAKAATSDSDKAGAVAALIAGANK